jgi:nucleoside-diphosphate-sugar epimerase
MKQSVLVTGGAGYLGSVLVPALLAEGFHVHVLDNFMYRQNSLAQCCANERFSVTNGDTRQEDVVRPLIAKADIIIPLAALVGAPICKKDPIGASSTNLGAIKQIVQLASEDQQILMPITNSGYGVGEKDKYCTEDSALRPLTLYGRDKVAAEQIVLGRKNSISFRLATVFGMAPRMRIDLLVNDFVYRAVNDRFIVLFEAHFRRNFIHVADVARVFLHGIRQFESMRGLPYNVGLDEANLSKWQLCEEIRKHVPDFTFLEAPVGEDPDKRDYVVSNARVAATGYRPVHSLGDGIIELIKGFAMIKNTVHGNV